MNYPNNMLVEFVHERHGGRNCAVGTFVGIKDRGIIRTGFSRCNISLDTFNKESGVAFACQCILVPKPVPVGRGFAGKYAIFIKRCSRYFKDAAFPAPSNFGTRRRFENRPYPSELNNLWNEMMDSYIGRVLQKPVATANQKPPMDQNSVLGIKASKCFGCKLEQACFPPKSAPKKTLEDIIKQEKAPVDSVDGNVETDKRGMPLPPLKKK